MVLDTYLTLNEFYQIAWKESVGIKTIPTKNICKNSKDVLNLYSENWSSEFENLMRNRLIMGALRYNSKRLKTGNKYDLIASIKSRINKYEATGNKEWLVDVANYCLLEFVNETHPNAHFEAIDDEIHSSLLK